MARGFDDKVVWITGASAGIGRAMALELARRGADLVLSARRTDRLEALREELEALGRRALVAACDVADEDSQAETVRRALEHFGRLDVAIANAGFGVAGRIETLSAEDWHRQLGVNVVGAALTVRHALPALRETAGRIALIASVSAMVPTPGMGAYTASKYALRAIGQTLSIELAGSGVSCTTIHPGFVESEIAQVDNTGVFDASRRDPRPKQLMWPTDKAARVIVDAIERRKREYVFTGHGRVGAFFGKHWPGLIHHAMVRVSRRSGGDSLTRTSKQPPTTGEGG